MLLVVYQQSFKYTNIVNKKPLKKKNTPMCMSVCLPNACTCTCMHILLKYNYYMYTVCAW